MIFLEDRALINIEDLEPNQNERQKFLQGLITNDIYKASNNLIYSAMLNAQGRFLYDFFIFEKENILFLDCHKNRVDEIIKKLNFYKLRTKVKIIKNDEYQVFFDDQDCKNGFCFDDPRKHELGKRIYLKKNIALQNDDSEYHYRRIALKIAEGEYDLTYEKSLILEFDFDNLNAIDYKKGCYIGQELTARTHYKGQIRKKLYHIIINNLQQIEKNCEISCATNSSGLILSSVFYENQLHALALIKIDDKNTDLKPENTGYMVGQNTIIFVS